MKVTLLKFYPFETSPKKPRLLGYADVELDGLLVIRSIKLFESKYGGYFIQLPEVQKDGKSYIIIDIKSKEVLENIRRVIVDHYKGNYL
ncbi:septation protein SpoVG family protein [Hydrogenobacter thermophilus]|uniref:septation protein SpoVG family protein n=1 Tax=Hydrogenobacter thermophilus TaxID=940 RepID=UPI0030FC045C